MDIYGITTRLERAKAHLDSPEEHLLRYAALELRFCLEAVAYRQLEQYGDVFPGNMVGMWKADQILKLLASFDPMSNQEGELSIAPAANSDEIPSEWVSIGSAKVIPWRKFRNFYNKLGSFLHAPAPKLAGGERKPIAKKSFGEIIQALEDVSKATLIFAMKAVIHAKCSDCGSTVYVGEGEFDNDELVVCGNTKCNAIYAKHTEDGGSQVLRRVNTVILSCQNCEARIPLLLERLWAPITCPDCSVAYRINLAFSRVETVE
ncbi:DNA-directed RNA polymerase subunit RPC12/RpoP [Pseudomonas alcaligenes]|nr:DNA-directed RNA polymerase subunit RPC12/RpoP [Pseudomonas alcaligenes]